MLLEPFGTRLYRAEGPTVSFYGIPYPTRMAVAKLADGGLWIWSPVAHSPLLGAELRELGPVKHLVSPNKLHHLFLDEWRSLYPEAKLWAPPGLARRKPELTFDAELKEGTEPEWAEDLDQVIFRGSFALEEVAFYHRPSRTTLVCDLVQRHDPRTHPGLLGKLMKLDGLVGERGSTPREWRATFLRRAPARAAREKVLGWQSEQLLIAHGACATEGATEILRRALRWI